MNLNHIRIFVRVAEAGSFSEAARRLQLPKSQVSRQVRLLEEALGARLFERTTRQVRLTESGQVYFQRCRVGLNDLEEANIRISGMQQELRGLIRVTAPVDVGPHVITGLITEFLVEYPQLEVELNCTQRVVNLIEEEYDLGIRVGQSLPDSSLIARKLGAVSFQLFASPSLLGGHPVPDHPDQLQGFPGVLFQPNRMAFELRLVRNREEVSLQLQSRLKTDNLNCLLHGVLAGLGVGFMPYFLAHPYLKTGQLQLLLPEWQLFSGGAYAVYPSRRFLQPKVQLLVDYFSQHFLERVSSSVERPLKPVSSSFFF